MRFLSLIGACLGLLLAAGVIERLMCRQARRFVSIRIHVNGTRGKSTVTRLIAAALRAYGIPTLAKVTGTEPRLIMPDGTERPIRRFGPANIREQVRLLLRSRRLGVRALVVECMAIRPELQWTTEHEIVCATHGVITNVRTDHSDVMGKALADKAASLANTVPRGGTLILGEGAFIEVFQDRAGACKTRLVVAKPVEDCVVGLSLGSIPIWLQANIATAIAVTRELRIPDEIAIPAMIGAARDPGASHLLNVEVGATLIPLLDARAANDPESFRLLLTDPCSGAPLDTPLLIVFNHRADRSERLRHFESVFASYENARILITGYHPTVLAYRHLARTLGTRLLGFVALRHLPGALRAEVGVVELIVLCGNTRGLNPQTLVEAVANG